MPAFESRKLLGQKIPFPKGRDPLKHIIFDQSPGYDNGSNGGWRMRIHLESRSNPKEMDVLNCRNPGTFGR
jgi:hypothetical protein